MARILLVFRPRTGGVFAHVRALSAEMARRGHQVAVCGPDHRPGDVQGEFEVPRFPAPIPRGFEPREVASAVRRVGAAYRAFEPDLIHAHGAQAGVVARLARPAFRCAPLIHTPHRYPFLDEFEGAVRPAAYRSIERILMPLTSHVLCVCEDERRIAEALGARGKTSVVHNGVEPVDPGPPDPGLLELLGIPPAGDRGVLVLSIAELFPRKGIETLLEASSRLVGRNPRLRVVVAGGGPQHGLLRARVRELGLEDHVLLVGHVDGVRSLLGVADAFVNPAWFEAFPYGVLEAMYARAPCVVTGVGGVPEAIVNGESGLVVPPRDPDALASAVDAVISDPERARRRAEAARQRVLEWFTRDAMFDATERVYERMLVQGA